MDKHMLVVPFQTSHSEYLYDGVTSEIIPSSKMIETIIELFHTKSKEDIYSLFDGVSIEEFEHTYQYIAGLIEDGMFYQSNHKNRPEKPIQEQVLEGAGSQLIFVLTEKCNMRCEYCVYSDKYPHEIGYSDQEMNFEIAQKAVDEFLELHDKRVKRGYMKPPFICFYGGEPLIKIELIREIVAYIETIRTDAAYYITTNGLLLNRENAIFLAEHNFNVTFSIDGFKENHDRNRVTVGGQKTFDLIYRNVKNFQNIKKEMGKEKIISFNCCYDNYTNIYECVKFFEENYDLFKPFYCVYAPVKPYDTSYYDWVKEYVEKNQYPAAEDEFRRSIQKVKDEFFFGSEGHERFREIATSLFVGYFTFSIRNKWVMSNYYNSCAPLDKLAVYPDGRYALCEKMNARLPIGDVYSGVDYEAVSRVANQFKENFCSKGCSNCPAKNICSACFMYMKEDGEFDREFCAEQKKLLKKRLQDTYEMKEQGIDFMQVININKNRLELLESMK